MAFYQGFPEVPPLSCRFPIQQVSEVSGANRISKTQTTTDYSDDNPDVAEPTPELDDDQYDNNSYEGQSSYPQVCEHGYPFSNIVYVLKQVKLD